MKQQGALSIYLHTCTQTVSEGLGRHFAGALPVNINPPLFSRLRGIQPFHNIYQGSVRELILSL